MELGVLLLGMFLRLMSWLLAPVLWAAAAGRRGAVPPPVSRPELMMGAKQLAEFLRQGKLTSEEVVTAYIDRIKLVNPYINAVVEERFKAALSDARHADRRLAEARKTNAKTEELLGVPFTVKESCSLSGLSNSVGCLENAGRRATRDGEVVRLIRAAGAIPLLVSNTPELCLGWETTNLLRGTTNNPYCLSRTAGGSSGGEAALIASGASPFGVASDIAGSIRIPAAFNGVFGHKPTPGVISIEGHIPTINSPLFPRFLSVGPMCKRAEDLPLLTRIMAADRAATLRLDEPVDFSTLRVHYMTAASNSMALLPTEKCIAEAVVAAAEYLRDVCGSQLSDRKFKEFEDSVEMSISVFFSMKDMPNMLQDPNNPKRDRSIFLELLRSIFGGSTRSLQAIGFHIINRTKLFIPASRRKFYHEMADKFREEFFKALGSDGVLLYPVFPAPAHTHGAVFARASGVMYAMLLNVLGAPATSVPAGLYKGLPIAIQVIAAPHQDRLCLAVAQKLEEAFGGWRPPA